MAMQSGAPGHDHRKTSTHVLHVISHTHWDREWYQEFQGYRRRLVYQVDRLLEVLARQPDFRCFHLDGQTSCVEDYLAIRPENRARLRRLIRSGRILIGPWYVMSDEFLVSGESLVRNLALGHRICRELGVRPLPCGYVTDVFGHCSQLPQILRGFGIDNALLLRGTSGEGDRSEMVWEGADGTAILLLKVFPDHGYCDFLALRRTPEAEKLREYEARRIAFGTTPVLLALDGGDHEPARGDVTRQMERIQTAFVRTRCRHSSLVEFLSALRRALGPDWQRGRHRLRGELRTPAKCGSGSELITASGSSRLPLKQANDAQEWLLTRCAEPLHAWSVLLGGDNQQAFLDLAWKYLLQNHPHDSIVGCSIDQVQRDMLHRFDQSRALAQNAIRESLEDICRRIDTADAVGRCEQVVTAFNGAQAATGPVTTLTVELPSTLAEARRKQGLVPVLLDGRGVPLYCETAAVEHRTGGTTSIRKQSGLQPGDYLSRTATEAFIRRQEGLQAGYYLCWPDIQPFDRFTVNAVCSIPALAYRTWRVGFAPLGRRTPLPRGVSPVRVQPRALAMENGRIRVQVAKDGCFHLYDKATRRWYQGLHVLEDSGEAGSGYWHRAPPGDRPFLSTSPAVRGAVAIRFRQTGSLAATCILRTAVRVPIGLTPADAWKRSLPDARIRRSRRRTALRVTTRLTLRAGERLLECRTTIRNTAACHRLRVLFPTRLASSHWFGDSAFDAVRRSIRVPDTTGWIEQAREEAPIRNFVAACDRRCGLAVVTRGLNEACVQDSAERAIAVTLFRSYSGYLFQWTRDSLLLGDLATEYALVPFTPRDGAPPPEVYAALDRYKVPVAAYSLPPGKGHLPAELRFFDIEGPLVLSAIKRPEDGNGIALRAFNPFERRIAARLRPGFACTQVWQANVNETPTRRLPAQRDGTVCIRLGPKQIVTLLWRGAGRPARR